MKNLTIPHDAALEEKNHSLLVKQTMYAILFLYTCVYVFAFLVNHLKIHSDWIAYTLILGMFIPLFVVLVFGPFPKVMKITQQEKRARVIHTIRSN